MVLFCLGLEGKCGSLEPRVNVTACSRDLRLPARHRIHCRTTNLIERSFEEERRRTKVIPRFTDAGARGENTLALMISVLALSTATVGASSTKGSALKAGRAGGGCGANRLDVGCSDGDRLAGVGLSGVVLRRHNLFSVTSWLHGSRV